jgi:hypothetical protein
MRFGVDGLVRRSRLVFCATARSAETASGWIFLDNAPLCELPVQSCGNAPGAAFSRVDRMAEELREEMDLSQRRPARQLRKRP